MNPTAGALRCEDARDALSARLDGELLDRELLGGELAEPDLLRRHLAGCAACRTHERELTVLSRAFDALRDPEPATDLWPRIAARVHERARTPLSARLAAGFVGFLGLGAAAWILERERAPAEAGRHLVERLAIDRPLDPHALFASLPEYRVLRALPVEEPR